MSPEAAMPTTCCRFVSFGMIGISVSIEKGGDGVDAVLHLVDDMAGVHANVERAPISGRWFWPDCGGSDGPIGGPRPSGSRARLRAAVRTALGPTVSADLPVGPPDDIGRHLGVVAPAIPEREGFNFPFVSVRRPAFLFDFLVHSGGFAVEAEACGHFGGAVRHDHLGPLAGSDLRVVEIVANIRLRRFGFEGLLSPGVLVDARLPGRGFLVQSGSDLRPVRRFRRRS